MPVSDSLLIHVPCKENTTGFYADCSTFMDIIPKVLNNVKVKLIFNGLHLLFRAVTMVFYTAGMPAYFVISCH